MGLSGPGSAYLSGRTLTFLNTTRPWWKAMPGRARVASLEKGAVHEHALVALAQA
jgi:hypothetical protein